MLDLYILWIESDPTIAVTIYGENVPKKKSYSSIWELYVTKGVNWIMFYSSSNSNDHKKWDS